MPPGVSQYTPEHPAVGITTNAPAAGGTSHWQGVWWEGPEMLRERWNLRPDLTPRYRRTSTHRHNDPFPPSCTHIQILSTCPTWTHTEINVVHTLTLPSKYSILPGPGTSTPRGAIPDHGHGSLYAGVEKRRPPLVLQQQGSPPAQTQTSSSSQPSTPDGKQRMGCVKKGSPFLESAQPLTPMGALFPDIHQGQWVPGPIQTEAHSSSTTKLHSV